MLSRRPVVMGILTLLAVGTMGFGVAFAKDHLGAHPGLPVGRVNADAQQVSSRVIVIMRDQIASQPATRKRIGARIQAETSVDASVIAKVQHSGGRIGQRYHALNAFAASVSDSERSPLELSPTGRKGKVVRGTLYVDDFSGELDFGNELRAIPYAYTVG